jgi:hypothetical protein
MMNGRSRRILAVIILLLQLQLLGCSSQGYRPLQVTTSGTETDVLLQVLEFERGDRMRWRLHDGSVGAGVFAGLTEENLLVMHPERKGRLHASREERVPLDEIALLELWEPGAEEWISAGLVAVVLVAVTIVVGVWALIELSGGIHYGSN